MQDIQALTCPRAGCPQPLAGGVSAVCPAGGGKEKASGLSEAQCSSQTGFPPVPASQRSCLNPGGVEPAVGVCPGPQLSPSAGTGAAPGDFSSRDPLRWELPDVNLADEAGPQWSRALPSSLSSGASAFSEILLPELILELLSPHGA